MILRETIVTKICDICKKEVEEFAEGATEGYPKAISRIEVETWYGGSNKLDICRSCERKIMGFIETLE